MSENKQRVWGTVMGIFIIIGSILLGIGEIIAVIAILAWIIFWLANR